MQKKTPLRMCLGCRVMKPKSEIIRIVKSPDNEISLDTTGKKPGRGAYVCSDTGCLKRVIKTNALQRTFKMQIPAHVLEDLQSNLESVNGS